jgi:D-sedoheptulose 7-phosphate isomerase
MLGATLDARQFLKQVQEEITRLDTREIERLAQAIYQRYQSGRFVYIIGNGGSGANASHLCEDLGKGTVIDYDKGKRLKVLSLTDNTSYILAWANDTSYERVFVEQLKNLGEPGDLLIAISGSGNSPNILSAVRWANEHGIETFAVTGFSGGNLKEMARQALHCRCDDMGVVESLHSIAFHYVVGCVVGLIKGTKKEEKPLAA